MPDRQSMKAHGTFLILLGLSSMSSTSAAHAGGLLDPSGYASLGSLWDQSGSITIDTTGSLPVMTLANGTTIDGVFASGSAVFDFSSINLSSETIVVQGPWTLALLARGDISLIGTSINADGAGGFSTGGPGGGESFAYGSGGGAGFGGAGGTGGISVYGIPTPNPVTIPGGPGGSTYGGALAPFQGGSAGGAQSAGSGGGAIEIGASGNVNLSGTTIHADGGNGASAAGGGSGGSISILGNLVNISGSVLSAAGGNGGDGYSFGGFTGGYVGGGGGGGGGIIDVQANELTSVATYNLSGGAGGGPGEGGQASGSGGSSGSLSLDPAVPEPSGIVLGSLAILAGICYRLIRQ